MVNSLLCLSVVILLLVVFWPLDQVAWRRWFYRNIYLRTPYWKRVRREAIINADEKCQAFGCKWRGSLDVHHLTYDLWHEKPEDLAVLCRAHHERIGNGFDVPLKDGRKAEGKKKWITK